MDPLKDMMYYHIMSGIGHHINQNKIPMRISHGVPTFCNRKLLEIASTNDKLFSLCIAWINLGSSWDDKYGLVVGENVIDMIENVVLLELKNPRWQILGFVCLLSVCSQYQVQIRYILGIRIH